VSQLPLFETSWPMKNSRKLRVRSEEKVVSSKAAAYSRRSWFAAAT
jgi:hypothetical protein